VRNMLRKPRCPSEAANAQKSHGIIRGVDKFSEKSGLDSDSAYTESCGSRSFFLDRPAQHANTVSMSRQGSTDGKQGVGLTTRASSRRVPDRFAIAAQMRFCEIHEQRFEPHW